ncbi:MAG: hypothetical protein J0G33_02855 [Afipia felis]|nr:hypothetical protein [Afipia felis]
MNTPSSQRIAVARLVTQCERLIESGLLPERDEMNLREYVNVACSEFEMVPIADKPVAVQECAA